MRGEQKLHPQSSTSALHTGTMESEFTFRGTPHEYLPLRIPQAGSEPSTVAERRCSIASTSLDVAGRMEGHPNAFSKQTNCFSSPSARGTRSFLDRRKPPRKRRLNECSPGETWYTLTCLVEMAPTFKPSRKTLTTPPSPISGLPRSARPGPSRDAARTTTRVGKPGQIRFGARQIWMVAPRSPPMPDERSLPLVAATTSDLSPSWFTGPSYTTGVRRTSNKLTTRSAGMPRSQGGS